MKVAATITASVPSTHEYIFRSKLDDIQIPTHLPLVNYVLDESVKKHPNNPCIVDGFGEGLIYSYGEVELSVRRVAAGLSSLGIRKGDVVLLLLPNCPEFIFSFLSVAKLGAIVTAANPCCTGNEIMKQARSSGATLVITQSCQLDKLRASGNEMGLQLIMISIDEAVPVSGMIPFALLLHAHESRCPDVKIVPEADVVTLPFSSGTTSLPKGVELTHKNVVTAVSQLVDCEGDGNPNVFLHSQDRMLCVLPLFHIYCLSCVLLASLRAGASIVLMQKYDLGTMLGLIQKYQVTAACLVPPILLSMAKNPIVDQFDLSSLRFIISGAAPLGKELEEAISNKVPRAIIAQGYGMTEAGPLIAMSLAFAKQPYQIKSGSCGTIVRNTEAKIVDTETGESLSYNVCGEICIRGPQVMKGYLNNASATMATIDKGGWLHTGDVGFIDEDEELFIVDRVKELIKFKGFQVAPAEIEAILISHPSISDAAVVGKNDEIAGEIPVGFVVRNSGKNITEEEVKKFVCQQVVFYKRLSSVIFVDSIPKSAAGKILRKNLRDQIYSGK